MQVASGGGRAGSEKELVHRRRVVDSMNSMGVVKPDGERGGREPERSSVCEYTYFAIFFSAVIPLGFWGDLSVCTVQSAVLCTYLSNENDGFADLRLRLEWVQMQLLVSWIFGCHSYRGAKSWNNSTLGKSGDGGRGSCCCKRTRRA